MKHIHYYLLISVFLLLSACNRAVQDFGAASNMNASLGEKLEHISNAANYSSEHDRLHDLFKVYYNWQMEISPASATYHGIDKYNDRWDNLAPEGHALWIANTKSFIETLSWFDPSGLSDADQLNFAIYGRILNTASNLYLTFPEQFLLFDQIQGIHLQIPAIIGLMPASSPDDFENIISRLEKIPELLEGIQQTLDEGIARGIVMPKTTVIKTPEQLQNLISDNAEESVFFSPFKNIKPDLGEAKIEELRSRAKKAIAEQVNPAFELFHGFVESTYLPACRESFGIKALPEGEKWYAERIKYHTTTNMSAHEIHELGKKEVARIHAEMLNVIDDLGFSGDLRSFNHFLRTDPQFYFTTPEELIAEYRNICKKIDPQLINLFRHLPRTPYGVRAIPAYAEQAATTAYYQQGSYDAGLPAYFYANTYNLASRPKWEMEALSIHEAVPGHHLQIAIQQELDNIPEFRQINEFTAYVEGWGLYSESLGYELGMYTNPYSKYGQLTYEMWRAIRLVVDTGIHAFDWTRDDAIGYFMKYTSKSELDIAVEVDRYIAWPGQALAYKIGQLKIQELRELAAEQLGDKFDIRSFHDVILGSGSVPLQVLENNINNWIETEKSKP